MGNGQCERFNQTLLKKLGTLEEYQKSDWKAHVPTLVHAYNATFHDTTRYSPFFLMFGRHPRLAIDAFLGLSPDTLSAASRTEYVRNLRERFDFAYKTAQEAAKRSTAQHKWYYDLKVRNSGALYPGDRVLVKNLSLRGKQKLADRWERQPYIILSQPNPDIPVYKVKPENSRSRRIRTLHRNLLLPFMGLPVKRTRVIHDPTPEKIVSAQPPDTVPETLCVNPGAVGTEHLSDSAETTASINDGSQKQSYVIPQRRPRGTVGLTPWSQSDSDSASETRKRRPVRTKRLPYWMNSDEWIMSQTPIENGNHLSHI